MLVAIVENRIVKPEVMASVTENRIAASFEAILDYKANSILAWGGRTEIMSQQRWTEVVRKCYCCDSIL